MKYLPSSSLNLSSSLSERERKKFIKTSTNSGPPNKFSSEPKSYKPFVEIIGGVARGYSRE